MRNLNHQMSPSRSTPTTFTHPLVQPLALTSRYQSPSRFRHDARHGLTERLPSRLHRTVVLVAAALFLVPGCDDPVPPPTPTTVTVTPATAELTALESTVRFRAEIRDQHGKLMDASKAVWSSGDTRVATVDASGLATATGNGKATITATAGDVSGTATVTVEQRIAEVRVTPTADTLVALDDTIRLSAVALDGNGHAVKGAEFTWSSDDESVLTVDATGLATAVDNGTAGVTASVDSVAGSGTVTVAQVPAEVVVDPAADTLAALGDTIQMSAEAFDANGHAVADAAFAWASGDARVATVDGVGLVTATGPGTATVTATAGPADGSAAVTVEQLPVEVAVDPEVAKLLAFEDTVRLSAEAFDANGHTIEDAPFTWTSDDTRVATVDADGLVAATGNGTATITATAGDVSGTATVTVEQRPATVRVTPAADTLPALGDAVRLSAEALDANGHAVADAEIAWSTDDAAVATVDAEGLVTAVANGTATITATGGEATGSAAVTVEQLPVNVAVDPTAETLPAFEDTVRLSAEAFDANGHAIADAAFTWSSDDTLVATVDDDGLVAATRNGTATVTAAAGEATGNATVTVKQLPVRVAVSPAAETLPAFEDTVRLSAEAFDANGHAIEDAPFTWTSDDTRVATVDDDGLATATGNGTATITATAGEATGSATVTVDQLPVEVAVDPAVDTLFAFGGTVRLSAEAFDANGHAIGDAPFTWTSGDAGVATVDAEGLVTATGNGAATITATVGDVSGTARVTVEQRPATVRVTPEAATLLALEDTLRLSAVALDANGHEVADAEIAWASDDMEVATVGAEGLVTAAANGTATVTATAAEATGSATMIVDQLPVEVAVDPAADTLLALGDALRLSAEAFDANGHAIENAAFTWTSDDTRVATVDDDGLATATGNGTATITATAAEATGSATVTVDQLPVEVAVDPAVDTLVAFGGTVRLSAEAFDANGHAIADAPFTWVSDETSVATVDADGLVAATGNGTATITATVGDVSGTARVTVEQRPATVRVTPEAATLLALDDTVRLSAEVLDANGHAVAGAEVAWVSDDAEVATVGADGLATAVANGTATVAATAGDAVGSATVTVDQLPVEVAVDPAADTLLALGDAVRFSAEAFDANGYAIEDAVFTWTSDDTRVATVDDDGLATAEGNGTARVTATTGDATGTAAVTVDQLPVEVAVDPATATLTLGDALRLSAEAFDANGHAIEDVEFIWASHDAEVATVDAEGLVTAAANGTATVTATAGDAAGTATVKVQQIPVEVVVDPTAETLPAFGDTVWFSAEAFDANGHAIEDAEFIWASHDAEVATVDAEGLVTAVANGTATVTATAGDAVGTAIVTVDQLPVEVGVNPAADTLLALGDAVRFSAEAFDANGHAIADAAFTWDSDDTRVATVHDDGLATAEGNGTARVTATTGDAVGTAIVTVDQLPVEVAVDPATATLTLGDAVRFSAEAFDANGHAIADAEFIWASDDTELATVDAGGLVTAVANGTATVTATAGDAVGTATVTVEQLPAEVVVDPTAETLPAFGDTVRLSAEAFDANGNAIEDAEFIWASDDTELATVDAEGLVTAVANGTATVTATAGDAAGTATVTVKQLAIDVEVDPAADTLLVLGDTVQLSAEAFDANGNAIADAAFTWTSDDTLVATVDNDGLTTAEGNGTATITAAAGAATGSAAVTVELRRGKIAEVTVSPTTLAAAEAGKQGRDTMVVTVTDSAGSPVADASYAWTTDRHSGWVYPSTGSTDDDGRFSATWVAGWPGSGKLSLTVENSVSRMTVEVDTRSTTSENNPSGAAYFWVNSDSATGYSVDLTPLAEPEGTYYAALQWDGGYTGIQRKGSHYDRQLQFSVWDVSEDDTTEVVETGEGVKCYKFGGEGNGTACNMEYEWEVGSAYRFEMTEAARDGGSNITVHVTDVDADERHFVGTLWFARRAKLRSFGMFVEDFLMRGEHCLAQEVRSAAIRRAQARIGGEWESLTDAILGRHGQDFKNPGTPACANQAVRDHSSGLELVIGGQTSRDPNGPTRFKVPE